MKFQDGLYALKTFDAAVCASNLINQLQLLLIKPSCFFMLPRSSIFFRFL